MCTGFLRFRQCEWVVHDTQWSLAVMGTLTTIVRARGRTRHGGLDGVDDDGRGSLAAAESKKSQGGGTRVETPNPAKRRQYRALSFRALAAGPKAIDLTRTLRAFTSYSGTTMGVFVYVTAAESSPHTMKMMNTTQGWGPHVSDYGLGEISSRTTPVRLAGGMRGAHVQEERRWAVVTVWAESGRNGLGQRNPVQRNFLDF